MRTKFGDDYVNCLILVKDLLGSLDKATLWMETENPMLGDVSPRTMIELGRTDRLLKFIRFAAEEQEARK